MEENNKEDEDMPKEPERLFHPDEPELTSEDDPYYEYSEEILRTPDNEELVDENVRLRSQIRIIRREYKQLEKSFTIERRERERLQKRSEPQRLEELMFLKKTPPHDGMIEESILGNLIKNPKLAGQIDFSQPYLNTLFYYEKNKHLHTMIMKLGEKVSVNHLINKIKRERWYLEELGGYKSMVEFVNKLVETETITDPQIMLENMQIIEKYGLFRQCIIAASKIIYQSYEQKADNEPIVSVPEFIRDHSKAILELIPYRFRVHRDLRTDVTQTYEEIKELIRREGRPLISTGYLGLDRITYGIGKDFLMVVGALAKVGKTTLALNIAENVANQGKHVVFYSYNTSYTDLIHKLIARNTDIDSSLLKYHEKSFSATRQRKIKKATEYIKKLPLKIESGRADLEHLIDRTKNLKRLYPDLSLVVVDELQSFGISVDSKKHKPNVFYNILLNLKQMSKELNITTILNAQLKQDVDARKDKKPMSLTDLADCKGAGDVVDAAIALYAPGIHWEDEKYQGWMSVIPLALRVGEKKGKQFRLAYDKVTSSITEI
ncbi:hypothetical protein KY348_03790 [Candidatus Woesearchaeota archaeon]|nr:hypothetical protein [Candidatus Woesearchaeota archaeon]